MKTLLAATAILAMTATGALAACGHDMVRKEETKSVASLDLSTTASTVPDTGEQKPARPTAPSLD